MKNFKKVIAVLLCAVMLMGTLMTSAGASAITEKVVESHESRKEFGDKITDIIMAVLKGLCTVYPKPASWKNIDEYTGENVYDEEDGRENYQTETGEGNGWKVGYASGSIIPSDFEKNKYYMGRQLNVVASAEIAKADGILDDQRVRVICMDDKSGEGAVVFAVIDGLGVTSATIRSIRAAVSDMMGKDKIAAVNISATHCHSALDTQGVSTSMLYVMFANTFTNALGLDKAKTSNDAFIENIINVTSAKIREAYANMEDGELYYDTADVSDVVFDKRGYIEDENIPDAGILHFVPTNEESKETYFVNMTCHPTTVSAKAGLVSGDYPYYMDYAFSKQNYNFVMTQGAVGQVSSRGEIDESKYANACKEFKYEETLGADLYDKSNAVWSDCLGEYFAEKIMNAKADGEEQLQPVMNAKYSYIQFTAENWCLHLACRIRLVDNEVYKTGNGTNDVVLPSEVGYVDFGGRVAVGLFPAELYPEVFHGQDIITVDKENYSWDGTSWDIASGHEMTGEDMDAYAVCFCNDYIGYVVPDNYYSGWGHWALEGSDEANFEWDSSKSIFDYAFGGTADELLSAGKNKASSIMNTFKALVESLVTAD